MNTVLKEVKPATGWKGESGNLAAEERSMRGAAEALHERLRVSARMLKAFESQMARVEAHMAHLAERERIVRHTEALLEQRAAEFEATLKAAVHREASHAEDMASVALNRFQQELIERTNTVHEVDARITQLADRMESLSRVVATAHDAAGEAAASSREAVDRVSAERRALEGVLANALHITNTLAKESAGLDANMSLVASTMRDVAARVDHLAGLRGPQGHDADAHADASEPAIIDPRLPLRQILQ